MAGTPRRVAAALLVVLLPLTLTLWVSLVFLLQLEVRNRLAGSPGESSPLYLALLGLPAVALVSVACLAAALSLRASTSAADITRGLLAAAGALLVVLVAVAVNPSYAGALREFAALPWRALTA
jgi:hypothetical protein